MLLPGVLLTLGAEAVTFLCVTEVIMDCTEHRIVVHPGARGFLGQRVVRRHGAARVDIQMPLRSVGCHLLGVGVRLAFTSPGFDLHSLILQVVVLVQRLFLQSIIAGLHGGIVGVVRHCLIVLGDFTSPFCVHWLVIPIRVVLDAGLLGISLGVTPDGFVRGKLTLQIF